MTFLSYYEPKEALCILLDSDSIFCACRHNENASDTRHILGRWTESHNTFSNHLFKVPSRPRNVFKSVFSRACTTEMMTQQSNAAVTSLPQQVRYDSDNDVSCRRVTRFPGDDESVWLCRRVHCSPPDGDRGHASTHLEELHRHEQPTVEMQGSVLKKNYSPCI